ncbi:MAG: ABC transporter substrate-binding protein [Burkholderiaceae bacterium]|nr:MAG: ABC transporter substrate-binding protein [Burkholderiaceae bacterium]TAM02128.1 MAG: ABC transporter substrate-binding protein [Pusillimonas sp.]
MKRLTLFAGVVALAFGVCSAANAADIKIGFISALTGPNAAEGIPYLKAAKTAIDMVPRAGGHTIKLITLNDNSDISQDVRDARKLISDDNVDVLISGSSVAGNLAVIAVGRETETPQIVMSPVHLPEERRGWTFSVSQPASMMLKGVVDEMRRAGVHTVGFIGFSDAWGDLAYSELVKNAAADGLKVVANERYARSDVSVTGQVLKVMAAHPDAVITGTVGSAAALPYVELAARGYRGKIYGTHGNVNADFVRLAGKSINGLVVPAPPGVVAEQLPENNPIRKVALAFQHKYKEVNGEPVRDTFAMQSQDAWLLIANAASRVPASLQPGTKAYRVALRDALATTRNVVGTLGVYDFKPGEVYGVDTRARVIVKLENGSWELQH